MQPEPELSLVVRALRVAVIDHFESNGRSLADDVGRRTLDTNSTLAPVRADLLMRTFLARSGHSSLEGVRVADIGCGLGALSVVLAAHGATVIGVDPNFARTGAGAAVARDLGLDARFVQGSLEDPGLSPGAVDLVVVNNALCYLVPRRRRRTALRTLRELLVPGGWIVMRDPNRAHPRDPFSGIPFIHWLPPAGTKAVMRVVRRPRSHVRLRTPRGFRRSLSRAGFTDVQFDGSGGPRRLIDRWAAYQHFSARRPVRD